MKKNETEVFSEEQIENVSNMLENNYHILKEVKDYHKQSLLISRLYEDIIDKIPNSLKDIFYQYDNLIWDNRRYELSLLYHLGIKKGIEMKELKS